MRANILGNAFDVAPEPADFWGWILEGRYDNEFRHIVRLLRPEHTFVDIGAWVGSHSLLASTVAKRVVAIEPDPVAFKILDENLRPLRITAINVAIGRAGTVELGSGCLGASTTRANRNAGGGIGAWEPGQQFTADSITLRELCDGLPDPLFLKIDVEGSEEIIFEDFAFFAERKPTVYLENHPWWWMDGEEAWKRIRRVAELYEHHSPLQLDAPERCLMLG